MKIIPKFKKRNCLRKELSKILYLGENRDSLVHILMNLTKK